MRALALLLLLWGAGCSCVPECSGLLPDDPVPVALLDPAPGPAKAQSAVIISVDGLRPDAIEAAGAETLRKLIARGAYCARAETIRPSITLPSHTAMLTGLDFKRHGVVWNNFRPGYIPHPTVFSISTQSGKSSAMLFSKDKFHFLANPKSVSWIYGPPVPGRASQEDDCEEPASVDLRVQQVPLRPGDVRTTSDVIARAFAQSWPSRKFFVTFVHFRECDVAGHSRGWMSPEYLEAVRTVDKAIGEIVAVIEKNGGFEKFVLIISADHGGSGHGHHRFFEPSRPENVTIPWICVGPGVPAGLKIDRVVRTYDTAPTVLAFVGLGAPQGIDGKAVSEVLNGAVSR